MLIVTYDEHGGFYDHVVPPATMPTGSRGRKYQFAFDQFGVRVPAVIVSPLIRRNLIDHCRYEYSSIAATQIRLFDLNELTVRSSQASDLKSLATLDAPRQDAPMTLPDPTGAAVARVIVTPFEATVAGQPDRLLADDPAGRVTATIASGLAQHLEVTPPGEHEAIKTRVDALRTYGEALAYLKEVYTLVNAARLKAGVRRSASVRLHQ